MESRGRNVVAVGQNYRDREETVMIDSNYRKDLAPKIEEAFETLQEDSPTTFEEIDIADEASAAQDSEAEPPPDGGNG